MRVFVYLLVSLLFTIASCGTYLSIRERERGKTGVEDEVIEITELLHRQSKLNDGLHIRAWEQHKAWGESSVMIG